jgi:hypothetical protein
VKCNIFILALAITDGQYIARQVIPNGQVSLGIPLSSMVAARLFNNGFLVTLFA